MPRLDIIPQAESRNKEQPYAVRLDAMRMTENKVALYRVKCYTDMRYNCCYVTNL